MNHSFGRSGTFMTLGCGGVCCFTAKSDLSTLLDDIRAVRPTMMAVVPRICELIHQRFQGDLTMRVAKSGDPKAIRQALISEVREEMLGGRLLSGSFGSGVPRLRDGRQLRSHGDRRRHALANCSPPAG